jgi:hypothetical protein
MQREWLVAGALVVVVVAAVLAVVLFPGALADRTEPQPDADLQVEEIYISADNVGGERLDLATDVRLAHTDGVSENVTVGLRAIGLDSGLVEDSATVGVGTVEADRELSADERLRVERGGSYRVEAVVYRNGVREATGSKTVEGTEALTPGYPDNPVEFHRFARFDLPEIDYQIAETDGDSATLDVTTYLTNSGETTAEDLTLLVKARQVESGIVASEQEVDLASVGPSQTAQPGVELTVPSQYNYYLDAILWKNDVIVETTRAGASLDPTERVPANESERDVALEIGDFESDDPPRDDNDDTAGDPGTADGDGAGLGVGIAVLAVLAGIVLQVRIQRNTND